MIYRRMARDFIWDDTLVGFGIHAAETQTSGVPTSPVAMSSIGRLWPRRCRHGGSRKSSHVELNVTRRCRPQFNLLLFGWRAPVYVGFDFSLPTAGPEGHASPVV
jgi:hypothetical protein